MFPCCSLLLPVNGLHNYKDDTSFWHFLNSWSEISNDPINLSKAPVFRRWFADGMDIPFIFCGLMSMSHNAMTTSLDHLHEKGFSISQRNATLTPIVTMKANEVIEHGIGEPTWRINRLIAAMTKERFERLLESWTISPDFVTLSNWDALTASNSPLFNMYGSDFEWGKSIAVRCRLSNKCDRMLTLYSGAEKGSINFEVCLFPRHWRLLQVINNSWITRGKFDALTRIRSDPGQIRLGHFQVDLTSGTVQVGLLSVRIVVNLGQNSSGLEQIETRLIQVRMDFRRIPFRSGDIIGR
ncbi:hypothetical protein F3Y22_tig00110059pilonHSYRG00106 [Hibiscus syriacus]|uniref:Uncharacterized protein n=1 Tax=Hibiscus syriacus TaxID=106335 RepID=A0A6A3BKM5_HIBSY|nr:hypothetical protein F3Y22_tig00110059pilonHSYRG00106 [Hibiscus syriacus]